MTVDKINKNEAKLQKAIWRVIKNKNFGKDFANIKIVFCKSFLLSLRM